MLHHTLLPTPKEHPTGDKLVRLADVPLDERLHALHRLMRQEALTPEQAQHYLSMIVDPGDISARIAA